MIKDLVKNLFTPYKVNSSKHLPSLEDVLKIANPKSRIYIGVRQIETDKIIGSEGRYSDFDRNFKPINLSMKSRLAEIQKLFNEGFHFPPISVFKIDDFYFVRDGNHRVAIAKERGQIYIDAEITEYILDVPITKRLTEKDKAVIKEHSRFLKTTGLFKFGRDAIINLDKPEDYNILLDIIKDFTDFHNQENNTKLNLLEGADLWYHKVFLPFAGDAYRFDLLSTFPLGTTGNLYIWLQKNSRKLKELTYQEGDFLSYIIKQDLDFNKKDDFDLSINKRDIKILNEISTKNLKVDDNFMFTQHIAIAVVGVNLYISNPKYPQIVVVKRRYHPCEGQWSLPMVMLRVNEEIEEAVIRCNKNVIGLNQVGKTINYGVKDKKERYPFGRVIAINQLNIIFDLDKKTKFTAGHLAQSVGLYKLSDVPKLVFDHSEILESALNFIRSKSDSYVFFKDYIPKNLSFNVLDETLNSVIEFCQIKYKSNKK